MRKHQIGSIIDMLLMTGWNIKLLVNGGTMNSGKLRLYANFICLDPIHGRQRGWEPPSIL